MLESKKKMNYPKNVVAFKNRGLRFEKKLPEPVPGPGRYDDFNQTIKKKVSKKAKGTFGSKLEKDTPL